MLLMLLCLSLFPLTQDARQESTVLALQRLYDDLTKAYPPQQHSRGVGSGLTMVDAKEPQRREVCG
jgi:hypothetical protein